MAGHSRSKNGVASLAYVPAIPLRRALRVPRRDARDKRGHDRGQRAAFCTAAGRKAATSSASRTGFCNTVAIVPGVSGTSS